MSLDAAPKTWRQRVFAAKLETTTGTGIALSASDATTKTFDPSLDYETEVVEIEPQGNSHSPMPNATGARPGRAAVTFQINPSGGASISWAKFLQACGMTLATTTLTPVTGATDTITAGMYRSGKLKLLAGCMGNAEIAIRRGLRPMCTCTYMGVQYTPPSDTAVLAPTYDTYADVRVGATTLTIGGDAYRLENLNINLNNNVILRPDLTAVNSAGVPTGYRAAYITGRRPIITIDPESVPLATKDWEAAFHAQTTFALSCVYGSGSNGTITISAPKMVLNRNPVDQERDGLLCDSLEFLCTRNTNAGDDELSIAQS